MSNNFYQKHQATLAQAIKACASREYWSPFVESPSARLHPPGSAEQGKADFEALLAKPFELDQPGEIGRTGVEVSPYTQQPLGINYPQSDPDCLFKEAREALSSWRKVPWRERAGVCLEMAFALEQQAFANAHATMHTAGQSYLMAFSGSGANALDRGVEAIAQAAKALGEVTERAQWRKGFGRAGEVTLEKEYRVVPRGVAAVICCATFPLWNAYPAMFANLVTGNPVIVKPHPNGILPVAMAVKVCREVLKVAGYNPNLVLLAADSREQPITLDLLTHDDCAIVDYTGSQKFGQWIEQHCVNKLVFTETAGCNGVVVQSTDNLDGLVNGLANAFCGFSAQMCTSPQNVHIPADGFPSDQGQISFDQFSERLTEAIAKRTANPATAAALCATIQADQSLKVLDDVRQRVQATGRVALDSQPYEHPDFPDARTATPMVCEIDSTHAAICQEEHFAPVSFLIRETSAESALANAADNAQQFGAIASYLYSADSSFLDKAQDRFAEAGASLWCNMPSTMPINFAAAYSDYHVTGLNPAGNACLTDMAFVANRFRIVQFRQPA
ncbi:MAG: phenylacetic acid degradation protein PaaN [Lysobacterales bacterium]